MTLKTYVQLETVRNLPIAEDEKGALMMAIYANKSAKELGKLTLDQFNRTYKDLLESFTDVQAKPIQQYGEFKLPNRLGQYPLRAWIPLEAYVLKNKEVLSTLHTGENIALVLAVACMPTDESMSAFRNDPAYEDWNSKANIERRKKQFDEIPAEKALGMYAFFLKLCTPSNKLTLRSLMVRIRNRITRRGLSILRAIRGLRY